MNRTLAMRSAFEWTPSGALPLSRLIERLNSYRQSGQQVVTTNGCFDLLHPGHISFLSKARAQGDVLIVGLNSDASVRRLKGPSRPILSEMDRAAMLSAQRSVDHVVIFNDSLPNELLALIQPDVHCKAADYTPEAMPEAEVVRSGGGSVRILPLSEGYSTSQLMQRVVASTQTAPKGHAVTDASQRQQDKRLWVSQQLFSGANVLRQTAYRLSEEIVLAATTISEALSANGKLLLCGNGGSAADAQHIAAELVGRFRRERHALPAIALTVDTSILTAVGNDYGFEQIFARQIEAFGQANDVLVVLSTSGRSRNVLQAVEQARKQGLYTIGLTGRFGGFAKSPLTESVDLCLCVPAEDTALIQQAHMAILHIVCDLVEQVAREGKPQ